MQKPIEHNWPNEFLNYVYQQTGGHPFLLQFIMEYVFDHMPQDNSQAKEIASKAIEQFYNDQSWQLKQWWEKYCSPDSQQIYHLLPDDGSTIEKYDLIKQFDGDRTKDALEILQHVGIIRYEGKDELCYNGELFRNWYRDNLLSSRTLTIESLIAKGEGQTIEFKESLYWNYKLDRKMDKDDPLKKFLKEIVGMLNADGGHIIIGVTDDKTLLDLQKDYEAANKQKSSQDGYRLAITNKINDLIGPEFAQYITITFHEISEKDICMLTIESCGPDNEAYLTEKGKKEFYLRFDSSTRFLDTQATVEHLSKRKMRLG
jgi:hypothetical protein